MEYTDIELKNEQWKDIDGYDGMYQVSDLGRVRSKKYGYWKVLRQGKTNWGYLQVALSKENKVKRFSVHRLVAQAFIPNDDESKTQINHRNECKDCNKVSNLEWCSASYNMTYNDIHHRRISKRDNYRYPKIKELYDPNLSYRQNIELIKSNGIPCSKSTLQRLRNDLGLTKYYRPRNLKQINV